MSEIVQYTAPKSEKSYIIPSLWEESNMVTKMRPSLELLPDELRWTCDPESLGVKNVNEVPVCKKIIGQDRALRAIRLGLGMKSHGYNIYVSGLTGTGKTTTVKKLLEQMDSHGKTPDDICYVYNFGDPDDVRLVDFGDGLLLPEARLSGLFFYGFLGSIGDFGFAAGTTPPNASHHNYRKGYDKRAADGPRGFHVNRPFIPA